MKIRISTIFIIIIVLLIAGLISLYIFPGNREPFQQLDYPRDKPDKSIELQGDPTMTDEEIRILKKINIVGNQLTADAEFDNVDTSFLRGKQLAPAAGSANITQTLTF